MNDKPEYLIRKGAYWYRPNCQGYTANAADAGRYTRSEAELYTHPNGPSGPRDGLSYVHESEVPTATPQPDASALVAALKGMVRALDMTSGMPVEDRVAVWANASTAARAALTAWEAQHG